MKFSVLIPSIPSRLPKLEKLFTKLQAQVTAGGYDVEILSFLDNKKRSIGYKRDALVQIAAGDYLAFCDDDDDVYDNYLPSIMPAIESNTDVIVFTEHTVINGEGPFCVRFGIENENEECRKVDGKWVDITRKPFHSCIWKSAIAKSEHFPDASYGEDWHWCKRLIPKVKTQHRIDAVIKRYTFDDRVTEAAIVFPKD